MAALHSGEQFPTNQRDCAFVTFIKYKPEAGWAICGLFDGSYVVIGIC